MACACAIVCGVAAATHCDAAGPSQGDQFPPLVSLSLLQERLPFLLVPSTDTTPLLSV